MKVKAEGANQESEINRGGMVGNLHANLVRLWCPAKTSLDTVGKGCVCVSVISI